jgi:integrase
MFLPDAETATIKCWRGELRKVKMKEELLEKYRESLPPSKPAQQIAIASDFLTWLGNREFTKENILKYNEYLRRKGYADGTIIRRFSVVHRLAVVNGIPCDFRRDERPEVQEINIYTPALDPDDIKAMVDCVRGMLPTGIEVRPEHAAFLALSTVYGLRRVELLEIEPQFVDTKNQSIFIKTAKKGRQRYHLIPDNIVPYLDAWDFQRRFSKAGMTRMFEQLKDMIGLEAQEVGWHSIRRSAIAQAWRCGLTEPDIFSFYRWKRPMSNMALRYATAKVVGRAGEHADLSYGDRQVDELVFQVHPFLRFWD